MMPVSVPFVLQKRKKKLIHVVVNLRPRTTRSVGFVIVENAVEMIGKVFEICEVFDDSRA